MVFKKTLQKLFQGYYVLEKVESPINGEIRVIEDWFGRKLVVGGLVQSGKTVERLWTEGLEIIGDFKFGIENCLVLGLGAGNFAKLVSQKYSGTNIVGIEIDPEIVRLGKNYFGLDRIRNLEIKVQDAIETINNPPAGEAGQQLAINNFDLILVDMYLGDRFPEAAQTDEFLQNIKNYLAKDGVVIFNRLYFGEKKEKTDKFAEKLTKFFDIIEAKKVYANKLFLCQ